MTTRIIGSFDRITPPVEGVPPGYHVGDPPPELLDWLADLLLLRGVPLGYLVPDPELLPPESVRFFHVDPNFTARLIDGALAAADLGSFDVAFHPPIARALREMASSQLAKRLFPDEDAPLLPALSGLLLRSELVRRWPGLLVSAWEDPFQSRPLVIARKDRIASGLLLVLFAGVPQRVEIAEPPEGTRFGVEPKPGNTWSVQLRNASGAFTSQTAPVAVDPVTRVVAISQLAAAAAQQLGAPGPLTSGHLSLCLQQTPYVQVFKGSDGPEQRRIRGLRKHLRTGGG